MNNKLAQKIAKIKFVSNVFSILGLVVAVLVSMWSNQSDFNHIKLLLSALAIVSVWSITFTLWGVIRFLKK